MSSHLLTNVSSSQLAASSYALRNMSPRTRRRQPLPIRGRGRTLPRTHLRRHRTSRRRPLPASLNLRANTISNPPTKVLSGLVLPVDKRPQLRLLLPTVKCFLGSADAEAPRLITRRRSRSDGSAGKNAKAGGRWDASWGGDGGKMTVRSMAAMPRAALGWGGRSGDATSWVSVMGDFCGPWRLAGKSNFALPFFY